MKFDEAYFAEDACTNKKNCELNSKARIVLAQQSNIALSNPATYPYSMNFINIEDGFGFYCMKGLKRLYICCNHKPDIYASLVKDPFKKFIVEIYKLVFQG